LPPELKAQPWSPGLAPEQAREAVVIAREVAARCTDPQRLAKAIEAASRQTAFPEVVAWQTSAVAEGDAGLALMCGYLDGCFPDSGWDAIAHEFLVGAARAAEREALPSGIFSGLAGLAFATWALARRGARYQRLLAQLDAALLPQAAALAASTRRGSGGTAVGQLDAISGLSGIGAYLLVRREQPHVEEVLEQVLSALAELTEEDGGLPRWHTPPELMGGDDAMAREFPGGCLNCGLAHGIPGPLALLALAAREDVVVQGQERALRRIVDWLAEHRADDAWGPNWPSAVPVLADDGAGPLLPTRSAWCYGSPGVARALWLAGDALGDPAPQELAVEAMAAVYRRPVPERRIDSPTFCHGVAGLLQITLRFAQDTMLPLFGEAAGALATQLLDAYDPDRLLGFTSLEPEGNRVDRAGLLDGAPGVALVLLAAATDVEPTWDRLFLLA
jgi:hypothetical protein